MRQAYAARNEERNRRIILLVVCQFIGTITDQIDVAVYIGATDTAEETSSMSTIGRKADIACSEGDFRV
jgi:hypothetical protein